MWITLGGNDAIAQMPACASKGKTAPECGDELMEVEKKNMGVIIGAAVAANPNIKILGFGYDIMFGGVGCEAVARNIFPQCWKGSEKKIECFNTQFIRLQDMWESMAKAYPKNVDVINILGTCQAAGGYAGTSPGHPDITKFAPAEFFPDTLMCIHPSVTGKGGDPAGATVVMEEMYNQYWSKELGC